VIASQPAKLQTSSASSSCRQPETAGLAILDEALAVAGRFYRGVEHADGIC